MHNNRNVKYVMRDPPPGPSKMCYPFSGNPVKYGGTLRNIDGVNGYMLCNNPKQTGCKTCSEWVDKGNVGCILKMTNGSPQFCVTSDLTGPISTGGCKNLPISGPGSGEIRSKIECLGSSSTPTPAPSPPGPGPAPGPGPTPKPSPGPPGPTPLPSPPSDPSTLILAIGGGVLGLIIIGIIIYYAVQRGKTKLKASTNKTNDISF